MTMAQSFLPKRTSFAEPFLLIIMVPCLKLLSSFSFSSGVLRIAAYTVIRSMNIVAGRMEFCTGQVPLWRPGTIGMSVRCPLPRPPVSLGWVVASSRRRECNGLVVDGRMKWLSWRRRARRANSWWCHGAIQRILLQEMFWCPKSVRQVRWRWMKLVEGEWVDRPVQWWRFPSSSLSFILLITSWHWWHTHTQWLVGQFCSSAETDDENDYTAYRQKLVG